MSDVPLDDDKDDLPSPDWDEVVEEIDIEELPDLEIDSIIETELPGNDSTGGRRNRG